MGLLEGVRSVRDLDPAGRRVFLRADLNAPLSDGQVADDLRLSAAVPTLRLLLDGGARVVLASHLGRPDGAVDPAFSMRPVGQRLGEILGQTVACADDVVGPDARSRADALTPGRCCCWRTSASIPAKRATMTPSPTPWPPWPTSTSTMPSALPTAPTPPSAACLPDCRGMPGCSWSVNWRSWAGCWRTRHVPTLPSLAARRSPTS
jgi:hypothetical protein